MPEIFHRGVSRARQSSREVSNEFRERLAGYLTGALGLVAGLAWNDAISSLIKYLFPAEQGNNLTAKFVYALVITFLVVILTMYLLRFIGPKKAE